MLPSLPLTNRWSAYSKLSTMLYIYFVLSSALQYNLIGKTSRVSIDNIGSKKYALNCENLSIVSVKMIVDSSFSSKFLKMT